MQTKNILITGISRGLGLYLSAQLVADGFNIIGIDLPEEKDLLPGIREQLINYYSYDISNLDTIQELITRIINENSAVHVLINNAGLKSFKRFDEYTDKEYLKILEVNFLAPALLCKNLIPFMQAQGNGKIINIASNAGFKGYEKGTAYCTSKGALHIFTQAVAAELNSSVSINTISPSTIATAEFIKENTSINPNNYIQPVQIYLMVKDILENDYNGKIIPMISFKSKIKFLLGDIKKFYNWFIHI